MLLRRAVITGVAITALCSLAFGTGPAGAISCPPIPSDAADGEIIDEASGSFIGDGILNRNGADQSIFYGVHPGDVTNSRVDYQNNDDAAQTIVVRAIVKGDVDDFKVTFFQANFSRDLTSKVLRPEGRPFRDIGPGFLTEQIRVRVKQRASAGPGAEIQVKITGNYETASKCADTVKVEQFGPV
jgi:hypothetical protein